MSHHVGYDDAVGVVFPALDSHRSSLTTGRAVFSDAVARVDSALATDLLREPDWRKHYHRHLRTLTQLSARSSVHSSRIARDGLDAIGHRMRFVRNAQEMDLSTALTVADAHRFGTHTLTGQVPRREPTELAVPYRGQRLTGDALRRQLDRWVADGITEPGFAAALTGVIDHPEWLDLSDLSLVILGAGAELAPFGPLVRRGATVAAVDLPRPAIWRRLIGLTRDSPAVSCSRSAARLRAPNCPTSSSPGPLVSTWSPTPPRRPAGSALCPDRWCSAATSTHPARTTCG